ncbi:hypothetical protein POM88_021957 [Heracleum sosnowskyi]|uniref:Uncharacterized protein n=1 Tax=Heracleum sosnowskyi TaxID=360622 RepID=A0AAD8IGW8_9APIA|nr:hypothetical protein POM88_021957 [Heracleum sosnowskyi]
MPGNEVGDRVHNFFEQEHVSQGQHHSQIADGNWSSVNNNFLVGNQRRYDALSSKTKDYSPLQSDLERAHHIQVRQVQHNFNSPFPTRADLANNRPHNQHQDLNGYIYGHQASRTGPEEANLVGVGIESNRSNSTGKGFSINRQSQGSSLEHPASSMRMDSFKSPVSYDFFGGQPKVSEHPNMLQFLPEQQSDSSDKQQLMFRKMKELQKQKDFQQQHARQQHLVKPVPSFTGQMSGNRSYNFINGTPVSDASPWATELHTGNTNWLRHASSAMQGSPGGLVYTPGQGQASQSGNSVHQQVDQSLPGIPISRLSDNLNQYQSAKNKSLQKMATYNNSFQGPSGRMNMENPEELSSVEKNVATQEYQGEQEIVGPSGMSHDNIVGQVPSSQNSDVLDPAEEKILFGSDDNSIWDAFGEKTVINGEASNLLDCSEFMNGLPSLQSGSWSALMQSAVAETSSSNVGIQEDWTNLSIQNPDPPTRHLQSSIYDTVPRDYCNLDKKCHENALRACKEILLTDPFSNSDGRRYSNHWVPLQNGPSQPSKPYSWTVTNGVTLNGDTPFDVHGKGDYVLNSQNGQKQLMHESLNMKDGIWNPLSNSSAELERLRSTTGSLLEESTLNTAAVLNSTKSRVGEEANFLDRWKPKEAFVKTKESEHSRKPEHLLNNGPLLMESTFCSSEKEVKTHEMDTFTEKENHNTCYQSNVSNYSFTGGSKEKDLSDASDSQSLASGKQKSSNPIGLKSAGPRKFQHHPMENSDEDVEPSYQMWHASHSKMMPLHNSEGFRSQDNGFFGQSILTGQLPMDFIEKGKGQLPDHQEDTNRLNEASFRGSLPGCGPEVSSAINKSVGMSVSDKASHSSENMLELLNKVDKSKEHSAVMHRTSTGYIPISQTREAESSDGIGGCLQQSQSSAAQGFGLQLAPPSQTGPGLNQFFSNPSQTGEGEFKTTRSVPGQTAIGSLWHTRQSKFSSESTHKVIESFRKEPGIQQLHGASSLNPSSNQRDIEAFGRTLKPNNFVQQNFSLTNQIRAMKGVATDPSHRGPKRQKGTKDILLSEQVASMSGQPYEADAVVEDAPLSSTSIPSEDPKMHDFSEQEDNGAINESENFQHGSSAAFIRTEHPDISQQMALSWFNQNGSFKDGQMLQMHDAHKAVTFKAAEPPLKQSFKSLHVESLEHMNVTGDTSEINNKHPNENSVLLENENLPLLQSLPPDNACEHMVVSRPKKRKFATFEIQSWQKEVSHSCQDLPSLRVAEANWAKAAKRLSEKGEDGFDANKDGLPMPRARRRLSLTRQIMQLLFPPPPAMILSEANSNNETVVYTAARRALGDTCSLMSGLESHDSPSIQANLHNRKTSDNPEQNTSQVMENFMARVRNLETELSRLDKKASVSDLRMEVQDVEKISIINRFAMFHSRLQADGADASSLHGAVVNSQKPFPQRYVTAIPLPRNLPDSVQCLSL